MDAAEADLQWWLARIGDRLVWARLRGLEDGPAEVLAADGHLRSFPSAAEARAALLDAEFRALDGLDEDDAATLGLSLAALQPPQAADDAALVALLVQAHPGDADGS